MDKLNNFIIRGSSAGMFRSGEYLGESATVCPRKTILRHLVIEETHSATTKEIFSIGHQFEKYFETIHPECEFEKVVTIDGILQGHADAVSDTMVYELKSVTSKNTRASIKKGKPKADNVLQLLTYMVALERDCGKLIYGDFTHIGTYDKLVKMAPYQIAKLFENAVPCNMTEFDVTIDEHGFAFVNGEAFHNINVTELIEFQDNLHELVKSRILPPRIEAIEPNSWSGPCRFCKLATLCDSNISDLEEFVTCAEEIYEQQI